MLDLIDKLAKEAEEQIVNALDSDADIEPSDVEKLASAMERVASQVLGAKDTDPLDESLQNILIDKNTSGRKLRQQQIIREKLRQVGVIE